MAQEQLLQKLAVKDNQQAAVRLQMLLQQVRAPSQLQVTASTTKEVQVK